MMKRFAVIAVLAAVAVPAVRSLADDNLRAECSNIDKWSPKETYRMNQKVKFKGEFDDAYVEYKCTGSTKEGDKEPPKDRDHWDKIAICCKC